MIDLREVDGVSRFADVRDAARRRGDDLVLDFGDGDRLRLDDIRLAELDRGDFLF